MSFVDIQLKINITLRFKKIYINKAISMMRGKSPQSDVEMSKKLNFVAAIFDFRRPSWIDNAHIFTLYSIDGNDHVYQLW